MSVEDKARMLQVKEERFTTRIAELERALIDVISLLREGDIVGAHETARVAYNG